jgi:hypothetical protein
VIRERRSGDGNLGLLSVLLTVFPEKAIMIRIHTIRDVDAIEFSILM